MSQVLNIHDSGLSKALRSCELPRITYVLFSPNLPPAARGTGSEDAELHLGINVAPDPYKLQQSMLYSNTFRDPHIRHTHTKSE